MKIPLTDHVTNEEALGSVDEKEPYWVESSLANWDASVAYDPRISK